MQYDSPSQLRIVERRSPWSVPGGPERRSPSPSSRAAGRAVAVAGRTPDARPPWPRPSGSAPPRSAVGGRRSRGRPRARRHARRGHRRRPPSRWRRACAPARSWCTSRAPAPSTSSASCRRLAPTSDRRPAPAAVAPVGRARAWRGSRARGARSTVPPTVERLALSLGMRPFRVDGRPARPLPRGGDGGVEPPRRAPRPGAAPRRRSPACRPRRSCPWCAPPSTTRPRSVPTDALTGPVARGDVDTVARHLDALPADERAAYRALAAEALRLSGRDDAELRALLAGDDRVITLRTVADVRAACDARAWPAGAVGFVPDHGLLPRGPPLAHARRPRRDRPRRREPVREPHAVRAHRGPRRRTRAISRATAPRPRPRASTCCSLPSVDEMYPAGATHHRPRRRPHRAPLRRQPARPLRRRHHRRRQAVLDRRSVPRLLRSQGRPAAGGDPAHDHATSTCRSRSSAARLVRERDGLALSSRNVVPRRRRAPGGDDPLGRALRRVRGGRGGASATLPPSAVGRRDRVTRARGAARLRRGGRRRRRSNRSTELTDDTLVALAAFVGKARLIDNVTITFAAGAPTPDLGVLTASSGMQEADH